MKKSLRFLSLLLVMICVCVMGVSASAAGELPDPDRRGSITVTVKDTETKKPVSGGSLELYQVADVRVDDWNFTFRYTEEFSDCKLELVDVQSAELAEGLAEYVVSKKMSGREVRVGENGKAVFSNLDPGLYLIMQPSAAKGYFELNPFLVTIPFNEEGKLLYDVNASPKAGTAGRLPESVKPEKPGGSKLPQTGQLWWPVPLLAVAGIFFALLGWMVKRNHE